MFGGKKDQYPSKEDSNRPDYTTGFYTLSQKKRGKNLQK